MKWISAMAFIALNGCELTGGTADLIHFDWNKKSTPYEEEIETAQQELARESLHNAELKRALPGYAK